MLIRIAMGLCQRSPALRRWLWRAWYQRLARRGAAEKWTFMNYGYVPPAGTGPELMAADEPDRLCIQLYDRVVAPGVLAGRRVLEVGCGRGGGASYLARYRSPAEVIAVDYSRAAVDLCRRRHAGVPGLVFAEGDAERLPFPAGSFDAVVNIESSHCYGCVERFFHEVCRVLRPGGVLLFADARAAAALPALRSALAAPLDWREEETEDLTSGVVAALAADDVRKRRLIAEVIPAGRQRIFGEFAALAGTAMYEGLRHRRVVYHRWVLRRR